MEGHEGLEVAESRPGHGALVGTVPTPTGPGGQLVLEDSRMVDMRQQEAWTRWESALDRKISWTDIWQAEPQRFKFLDHTVHDVLPSPANLHVWAKSEAVAVV